MPGRFVSYALALVVAFSTAAAPLPRETVDQIDAAVLEVLDATGVPSTSIAVVHDGAIALTKAYGLARIDPPTQATTGMRYPIGSISKQFVATAVTMLAAEGRLDLDGPIAAYFPEVTRAGELTLRQLLSHTSGIRDYWPQDYVPPPMLEPVTTGELIERFARQSLDFEPGSEYQYSNTGYVIAGAIVERVAGKSLMEFLSERIFGPLGMDTVLDIDRGTLTPDDATGYRRFALGPHRIAPKEGKGWLFAAGSLAMTAEDLAKWSVSLVEGTIPGPAVSGELLREVLLDSGVGTGYGLGIGLALEGERRVVGHGGEVSGFTARQRVYPDDRTAVVVLVNQDAVGAAATLAKKIAHLLFLGDSPVDAQMLDRVGEIVRDLRAGKLDRSLFTANANAYFSQQALADVKRSFKGLGALRSVSRTSRSVRGGLTKRVYRAVFKKKTLEIVTRATPDEKLEQFTISVE